MFYSHEVLTSRKYGFATVWLVATMGSGSKKVSRKAILDVDISKTCDTITAPSVPLALRLQSNLLYGVTRVYAQQCGYVLQDVESARNQMRAVVKTVHTSGLSVEGANQGRAEHLVLHDDPSFLPDFDLTLSNLSLTFEDEQYSHLAKTASLVTTDSRRTSDRSGLLYLGDDLMLGSFQSPASVTGLPNNRQGRLIQSTPEREVELSNQPQYQGLEEDLGLIIGDDGDAIMQEFTASQGQARVASIQPAEVLHNDDLVNFDDGAIDHPVRPPSPADNEPITLTEDRIQHPTTAAPTTTSETAQAPLRSRKNTKIVPLDNTIELSSRALRSQQANYLTNMLHDISHRQPMTNFAIARKNATLWMYGDEVYDNDPLSTFTGIPLLSIVANIDFSNTIKRTREETPQPETTRRVRPRDELDSAIAAAQNEDYLPDFQEIEQGREQPTPLNDMHHSTLLPWNQSTGSHRPASSHAVGSTGFAGRPRLCSLQRYSRAGTVSPSAARKLRDSHGTTTAQDLPVGLFDTDEHEVLDSVPQLDTQHGTESQWLRSALHDESMNFMAFVEDAIRHRDPADVSDDVHLTAGSIDFDVLLTPANHSYIVGAQAFLHVLVLGTKGLLAAEQESPFGSIAIRVL